MDVPPKTPYSNIPAGGVFSSDGVTFFLKMTDNNAVQMDNGQAQSGIDQNTTWIYFPSAALTI